MKQEERIIKSSLWTGVTDILIGIIFYFFGFLDWYYTHFHAFGIFGISLVVYSYWHIYFYQKETGRRVMTWKKLTQ